MDLPREVHGCEETLERRVVIARIELRQTDRGERTRFARAIAGLSKPISSRGAGLEGLRIASGGQVVLRLPKQACGDVLPSDRVSMACLPATLRAAASLCALLPT